MKAELPSADMSELLRRLDAMREARLDRPTVHSIRVTPHPIPAGWTHMYRTDGHVVIYVNWLVWEMVPKQSYGGIPLIEIRSDWLLGIPVYKEEGCPV